MELILPPTELKREGKLPLYMKHVSSPGYLGFTF